MVPSTRPNALVSSLPNDDAHVADLSTLATSATASIIGAASGTPASSPGPESALTGAFDAHAALSVQRSREKGRVRFVTAGARYHGDRVRGADSGTSLLS
jgi:hypothetical protein